MPLAMMAELSTIFFNKRSLLTKNLSNLATMWSLPYLLFDQVNIRFLGTMFERSKSYMTSSQISLNGYLIILPPLFSLLAKVMLKSPTDITKPSLTMNDRCFKEVQNELFSI